MTDILLGLIALATLVTALLQVVLIVALVRTARHSIARVERLKAMIAPLPAHLAAMQSDLQRMQELAGHQLGRLASAYALVEPRLRQGLTTLAMARKVVRLLRRASGRA